ncbi:hypothetical protein [Dongia sedimenti]|uniref:Protoheme IX farnesyltransferase n=1 Tax=Dongia sedimenti TaxID=3064282 RepID=A0ABU0YIY3_9PROT|nr:hypothetical protein [Rhodospirillaceae bacterium R-7]
MNAQLTEKQKRLRQRNWALLAALVAFVVLVYVVTIVKMKGG